VPVYENGKWKSQNLDIVGSAKFIADVTVLIDQIYALDYKLPEPVVDTQTGGTKGSASRSVKIGKEFLKELDGAGKKITIKTGAIMLCRAMGGSPRYALLGSWDRGDDVGARAELDAAIKRSHYKDMIGSLAAQLATPSASLGSYAFTPAQVKELERQFVGTKKPGGVFVISPNSVKSTTKAKDQRAATTQWESAINGFLAGGRAVFGDSQKVSIARRLESWLTPGTGCAVTVEVNFGSKSSSCALDGTKKDRPLAIGLIHELIHAYYSVTGTRLYPEASLQDESLTTGLPPEHFRQYSENRFRAIWPEDKVDLRLFYSYGNSANVREFICPFCGTVYQYERKVGKGRNDYEIVRFCPGCGGHLYVDVDIQGKLPASEL
jgi:hypothetical protein